jgi:hypothetical protein
MLIEDRLRRQQAVIAKLAAALTNPPNMPKPDANQPVPLGKTKSG